MGDTLALETKSHFSTKSQFATQTHGEWPTSKDWWHTLYSYFLQTEVYTMFNQSVTVEVTVT